MLGRCLFVACGPLLLIASVCAAPADSAKRGLPSKESSARAPVLNIRDLGAIGDGRLHRVSEWIESKRFRSLRAIQREYPFVDNLDWTIDEVAFEQAKRSLPESGGTIHFPAGHYVTGRREWRVWRDNLTITGDGAERTILATAPAIEDGFSVAPYRHVGWLEGAHREYPYTSDSGARGARELRLRSPDRAKDFEPGEIVFVRNGANRFDQDYGEFNEISEVRADGTVVFRHAFARDYTLVAVNWAAETSAAFEMPPPKRAVDVAVRKGEGFFVPPRGATVTIGEDVFRVERATPTSMRLANLGPANAPPGTTIPAGSKIAKSRTVLKLTRTTRNFRCEGVQIVGHRKIVSVSNSYDIAFVDAVFRRDLRDGRFKGGLTLDGDGGRFARFERCEFIATPAIGMQMARSFGSVLFLECAFTDTNVAFTEFNFDCEVRDCVLNVTGNAALPNVIIAGKSCGDLRFIGNRIRAMGVASVFDAVSDIHSQKHGSEGGVLVRDNHIMVNDGAAVFPPAPPGRFEIAGNRVERQRPQRSRD